MPAKKTPRTLPVIHRRKTKSPKPLHKEVTKPAIRRLSARGGVARLQGKVEARMRTTFKTFVKNLVREAMTHARYHGRKTVTGDDVEASLKRHGMTVFPTQ